jgi:hypothetical protein
VRSAIKEIAEIYAFLTLALQAESEGIFKVLLVDVRIPLLVDLDVVLVLSIAKI